jgi:sugar diacid utilization regulator
VFELLVVEPGDQSLGAAIEVRMTEAVDRTRRAVALRHQVAELHATGGTIVAAGASDAALEAHAVTLLEAVQNELADIDDVVVVLGAGQPVDRVAHLHESHRQAQLAARAGRAMPELGVLVWWKSLRAYGLVVELLGDREPWALIPDSLARLLADPDAGLLVPTLEAYLEHAGDARAAAAELFIHRSSLYNRLHRIEELAGVDIRSGADRLELHLGLRLWRLAGGATSVEAERRKVRRPATP